jgi:hypothetical protein
MAFGRNEERAHRETVALKWHLDIVKQMVKSPLKNYAGVSLNRARVRRIDSRQQRIHRAVPARAIVTWYRTCHHNVMV